MSSHKSPLREFQPVPKQADISGLRQLTIVRSGKGAESFGFRLRHFVKYPDAPSSVSEDERQRLRNYGVPRGVERLDTTFVISLKENGPAHKAGLAIGDRVVFVNGKPVIGREYADIVQLIQQSGPVLHLVVTSKEHDILQQCFPDAVYHPVTNLEPVNDVYTAVPAISTVPAPVQLSIPPATHPVQGVAASRTIISHLPRPKPYQPFVMESGMNGAVKSASSAIPATAVVNDTRKLAAETLFRTIRKAQDSENFLNEARSRASLAASSSTVGLANNNKRNSFAGGESTKLEALKLHHSATFTGSTMESLAMDRFKKSHEQKEEFLKRPIQSYSSLQDPNPPPALKRTTKTIAEEVQPRPLFSLGALEPSKLQKVTLPLVNSSKFVQNSIPKPFYGSISSSLLSTTSNHESDPAALLVNSAGNKGAAETVLQVKREPIVYRAIRFDKVSEQKRQTGNSYKAELSLLEEKGHLASVSQRKRDFEATAPAAAPVNVEEAASSNTGDPSGPASAMTEIPRALSGNRTVIVGSGRLHCEPPKDCRPDAEEPGGESSTETVQVQNQRDANDSIGATSSEVPDAKSLPANLINKRLKLLHDTDPEKVIRRTSYIKATAAERRHVESYADPIDKDETQEENNNLPEPANETLSEAKLQHSTSHKSRFKSHFFFPFSHSSSGALSPLSPVKENKENCPATPGKENPTVVKEGWLSVKQTLADGNRKAHGRSWKQLWAKLQQWSLVLSRDKKDSPEDVYIDLRLCYIDIATDYTKRKHVIRLHLSGGVEYLLQCEDSNDMLQWVNLIKEYARIKDPTHHIVTATTPTETTPSAKQQQQMDTTDKLYSSSKLSSSPGKIRSSWREAIVPKRRKKKNNDKNSAQRQQYHHGASFEVPLELCPRSPFTENVPFIVELCIRIIESRGLEHKGIYRVPGNKAAVNALAEMVNKGIKNLNPEEARWNDLNVIASLLKSFFQNLPEPLVPFDLYAAFTSAGKQEDEVQRASTIKRLIEEFPEFHYETLRFLLRHLARVAKHDQVNMMNCHNLARVFGPTLIRPEAAEKTAAVSMLSDIDHHNRCIETLIAKSEWFFPRSSTEALTEEKTHPDSAGSEVTAESVITVFTEAAECNASSTLASPDLNSTPKQGLFSKPETGSVKSLVEFATKYEILPEVKPDSKELLSRKRSASLGGDLNVLQETAAQSSTLTGSLTGIQIADHGGSGSKMSVATTTKDSIPLTPLSPTIWERIRRSDQEVRTILQRREQLKHKKVVFYSSKETVDMETEERTTTSAKYTQDAFHTDGVADTTVATFE